MIGFMPIINIVAQENAKEVSNTQNLHDLKWPLLKHYNESQISKIAMPIGGIGTGTVSLSGRGSLVNWEIMNRPGTDYSTVIKGNNAPFFAIHIDDGTNKVTKGLFGPLFDYEYEHMDGKPVDHHGIPRFSNATFDAAYPFGVVNLSDENVPVDVKIKAFNPLVPGDADASGIPIAVLRYEVTNKTNQDIEVSVCGSIRNFIGKDGSKYRVDWRGERDYYGAKKNINKFFDDGQLKGIDFLPGDINEDDPAWGTMALSTDNSGQITYRTSSVVDRVWFNGMLDFWDDFSADGLLSEKDKLADDDPMASLSVKQKIPANSTKEFEFYLTWHFPNRKGWSQEVVGNYYTEQYKDAKDVIKKTYPKLKELESKTLQFVNSFVKSDLPLPIKEAALFNLSTLRSQTVFRIASGHLMGWEGSMDQVGSCAGSCTHVWNYEQTVPFMFGELAKTMRNVEFNYATRANGAMSFRVGLPLSRAQWIGVAADGQMGCIMKMYREWQLSGDDEFLKEHWDNVKKALEFCWIEKGWDGDVDGVMEGCQHNTMDVEYFGPNPQMQLWYLGALKATIEMAYVVGDKKLSSKCKKLYQAGSKWTDENLFNGEYYEQIIMPPASRDDIAPGLMAGMGAKDVSNPDYQLDKGCLVDQMVGQYMSHICGLGYLIKPENARTTMQSIMKYNYKDNLHNHFNKMRSYAMGDESGLLMASFPKGRPKVPFPYFPELMTGFEYTAAVGMLYEGMEEDGLKVISSIRDRYNGVRRNPFNEIECGNHYVRAMAAWASILAHTGFSYSAVTQSMNFKKRNGVWFWSNGYSYGTVSIEGDDVQLKVLGSDLKIKKFILDHSKVKTFKNTIIKKGDTIAFTLK